MKKVVLASIAGIALLCMAVYAGNNARPKGTCKGYRDKNNNGFCDRSEKRHCKSKRCPASTNNATNAEALKKWEKEGKALEFSQSEKAADTAALADGTKKESKTKTPCPGNCANCPLAGACV